MDYSLILQTYTLQEILEYNDLTEASFLEVLEYCGFKLDFPPIPVDAHASEK